MTKEFRSFSLSVKMTWKIVWMLTCGFRRSTRKSRWTYRSVLITWTPCWERKKTHDTSFKVDEHEMCIQLRFEAIWKQRSTEHVSCVSLLHQPLHEVSPWLFVSLPEKVQIPLEKADSIMSRSDKSGQLSCLVLLSLEQFAKQYYAGVNILQNCKIFTPDIMSKTAGWFD